jgi:hypothetical protein
MQKILASDINKFCFYEMLAVIGTMSLEQRLICKLTYSCTEQYVVVDIVLQRGRRKGGMAVENIVSPFVMSLVALVASLGRAGLELAQI